MDPDLEKRVYKLEANQGISNVKSESIDRRLGEIEDTLKWLVRLVLGGIILAALTFVVSGGMAGV